jgi:carbamoyl-phosphate synthase large subunit
MNTPLGKQSRFDEVAIGTTALAYKVPCITTLAGAAAAVRGIMAAKTSSLSVKSIQEFHFDLNRN